MKKLILILAMLCMACAIALGFMNKKFLENLLADIKETKENVRVVTAKLGEREDTLTGLKEDRSRATDARNLVLATVDEAKQSLRLVDRKVEDNNRSIEMVKLKQQELNLAVDQVFPDGNVKSPDELRMVLTMLEETLTSKQNQTNSLELELDNLKSVKRVHEANVGKEEIHQIGRTKKILLGALQGTVIALNPKWGFVMVNAGRAQGVAPDASLLVKRGNSLVGRLRLIKLEENVCVCDVVKGSTPTGTVIAPGDQVIFENPFR